MTIVGLDDTDSREHGMCTTYVAARIADRFRERGRVERLLLIRLNPAVEHKTRGNAALAIHTDVPPEIAFEVARDAIERHAATDDERTNPGLVVLPGGSSDADDFGALDGSDTPDDFGASAGVHDALAAFARSAVRERLTIADAEALIDHAGYRSTAWGDGRGRIGALAAAGAWAAWSPAGDETATVASHVTSGDWTYECISYREPERWGTDREVDRDSVFAAAEAEYPAVWDTVDRGESETVCVPHTPCPILHGIRGDDREAVERAARAVGGEPVARRETFLTNQGTDAHLVPGTVDGVIDGRAYRLSGTVSTLPETRRGGHVFFILADPGTGSAIRCAAFEPTKRFRDRVRALRPGDRITACGEVANRPTSESDGSDESNESLADGTLKLEKFAVRDLVATERVAPVCPDCDRTMKSAGRNQGYRCRDCGTAANGRVERDIERDLEPGWYEVPPCARRHIAKPLVRGGFDAPTHPER